MRLGGDFAPEKINDPGLILGTKEYYILSYDLHWGKIDEDESRGNATFLMKE